MNYTNTAIISLDLDNLWSYMKIHGDKEWQSYPSYLNTFIPYVLDVLDELELKITFFIVGRDALIEENKKYLRMISERGHKIGNHSFNHESWINSFGRKELEAEIGQAEEAIKNCTGQKPTGFRGPGFSYNNELMEVLYEKGYKYDSTTLPTFVGPLARMYYFRTTRLSKTEKEKRKYLYGRFNEGFKKNKPYHWKVGINKEIVEFPVTTMPLFRLPFHMSYLIYINNISPILMNIYLGIALLMCKITGTPLNFLLHPLDLIGKDEISELSFFPGMNISTKNKTEVFSKVIGKIKKNYRFISYDDIIESMVETKKINDLQKNIQ